MTVLAPGLRYFDLNFQQTAGVIATAVFEADGRVALLDPGPSSTLPRLREELARGGRTLDDLDAVLLTHIHLDHGGAAGTLAALNPGIRVYVHHVGAPHMADPAKLLKSATRLYGDRMDVLWGEFRAVPAAQIVELHGGETLEIAGRRLRVAETPGHASHHVSYFDEASRIAFAGDVAGVRVPGSTFVLPPTPPPDIDLDLWHGSVARMRSWHPDALFLTHFGLVTAPEPHLEDLLTRLRAYAGVAKACLESGLDEDAQRNRFVREVTLDLRRAMSEADAARYAVAVPPEQCWQGLARYWKKRQA